MMKIPLKCPECSQAGRYDIEKILGEAITIYRTDFKLPAHIPDSIVVQCQYCPASFKVAKRALEQFIIDLNLPGQRR